MSACPVKVAIRYSVYERDKYTCQYCGLSYGRDGAINLTVDHIVSKSTFGPSQADNLRTACKQCNSRKGTKSIEEFRYLMRMYRAGIGGVVSMRQSEELIKRGINLKLPNDHGFHFEVDI
ncbi:HNH endonuclease [Nitrosomonas sp.]|uniref:HNH endonuclease n=1 Tax=Nitrosomonas sp. TaxID=42353 RepID=UPI00345D83C4